MFEFARWAETRQSTLVERCAGVGTSFAPFAQYAGGNNRESDGKTSTIVNGVQGSATWSTRQGNSWRTAPDRRSWPDLRPPRASPDRTPDCRAGERGLIASTVAPGLACPISVAISRNGVSMGGLPSMTTILRSMPSFRGVLDDLLQLSLPLGVQAPGTDAGVRHFPAHDIHADVRCAGNRRVDSHGLTELRRNECRQERDELQSGHISTVREHPRRQECDTIRPRWVPSPGGSARTDRRDWFPPSNLYRTSVLLKLPTPLTQPVAAMNTAGS